MVDSPHASFSGPLSRQPCVLKQPFVHSPSNLSLQLFLVTAKPVRAAYEVAVVDAADHLRAVGVWLPGLGRGHGAP